jgi:hypothetical protein
VLTSGIARTARRFTLRLRRSPCTDRDMALVERIRAGDAAGDEVNRAHRDGRAGAARILERYRFQQL